MADSRRRNVLIGLFMLGGLFSLGVLIVKFGEAQSWFGKRYHLTAVFTSVSGVRQGTQVYLNGVWVGDVAKADLADRSDPTRGIVVDMEVDRKYTVPRDWVAVVTQPLMGQPIITIKP